MKYLILTILFVTQTVICNDSVFMGNGQTAMPIKNDNVSMVSEVITVKEGIGLGWFVDVVAHFKNLGPEQTVQFGFPFSVAGPYPEDSLSEPQFHTSIDGIDVPAKRENSKNEEFEFNTVYLFSVHFQRGQTRTIHHSYTVGGEWASNGDAAFTYILKTGALWAKPIENIKIHLIFQRFKIRNWHCFSPTSQSVTTDNSTITLHWNYSNIRPDFNLKVERLGYLFTSRDSIDCETLDQVVDDGILAHKEHLRYIRNYIYAFYGYPFKDEILRAQFYYSGRFKESTTFDESKMDPRHKELIQKILDREK
jgi:hypothetical protein